MTPAKIWLASYNLLQAACWTAAFVRTSIALCESEDVWPAAGLLVSEPGQKPQLHAQHSVHNPLLLQSWGRAQRCWRLCTPAQVNSLLCSQALFCQAQQYASAGLVKGSPLTAFLQWAGRANVLFGVLACVPEVRALGGYCSPRCSAELRAPSAGADSLACGADVLRLVRQRMCIA